MRLSYEKLPSIHQHRMFRVERAQPVYLNTNNEKNILSGTRWVISVFQQFDTNSL